MGEFDEGESALRRAWEVAKPQIDPAAAVLLHLVTGQLHAARGQHQAALEAFAAGAQVQSRLTGVHAFATPVVGWLAATQARLGMPAEARETLTGFSAEPGRMGFVQTRAQLSASRRETPPVRWTYFKTLRTSRTRPAPRSRSLRRICSLVSRTYTWGIETPPLPRPRPRSRLPSQTG